MIRGWNPEQEDSMREAVSSMAFLENSHPSLTIESAIGTSLRAMWSAIPLEPLPAVIAIAVAGLALSDVSPVETWTNMEVLGASTFVAVVFPSCLAAIFVVLYLVKSALGVDLFDGPSFLHEFFFD